MLVCWLMLVLSGVAQAQAVYVPAPLENAALLQAINKPVLCSTKNQYQNQDVANAAGLTYRIPQTFPFACYNIQWLFT